MDQNHTELGHQTIHFLKHLFQILERFSQMYLLGLLKTTFMDIILFLGKECQIKLLEIMSKCGLETLFTPGVEHTQRSVASKNSFDLPQNHYFSWRLRAVVQAVCEFY